MKKIALFCLLAMASISLFGQSYNVIRENIVKAQLAPYLAAGQIESADGHLYLYYTDNTVWSSSKPVYDVLYCVSLEDYSVSEIQLQHLNSYNFVTMYEDGDNIYALYSEWQNKTKTYTMYMNTIEKSAKQAKWHPQEIISVTTEKRDGLYLQHAVSPDNSKMAFCLLAASKKNDFKGSVAKAFGEGGEQIWENNLDFNFANKTFSIMDFMVDNDGVAYAAICSYANATKSSREDETLHFVVMTDDNTLSVDERIDFGYLSSSVMKMLKNGKVALGGYYHEELTKNEAGTYMAIFDPRREEISVDKMEFPKDYYAEKAMLGIPAASHYATRAQFVEEYEDGSLLLLGEMRTMIAYTDNRGMTTYKYFARNIPVVYADANGKINDFAVIKKNQYASSGTPQNTLWLRGQGFSYMPVMHNNKVYLFYCDAMENYLGKSGLLSKPSYAPAHATAYCTIVPGQPIETKAILNGKSDKYRMIIPLLVEDDFVLGIGTNKKKMAEIVKVNHSF